MPHEPPKPTTLALLRPVYQDPKLTLPGYTREVHDKIIHFVVETAARPNKAALLAGLTSTQWQVWAKQAELGNPLALQVKHDIEAAKALAEHQLRQTILTDTKDPASNAKWLLEKMDPKEYSQRVTMEVDNQIDQFMDVLKAGLTAEEYKRVCSVVSGTRQFTE